MQTGQMVVYGHGVTYLSFSCLKELDGVAHGFSTRTDGFAADGLTPEVIGAMAVELGFAPGQTAVPRQVHGSDVLVVDAPVEPFAVECDAVLTRAPGLALGIQVADCVPVLLADRQGRAVGAVHAGWRGLVDRNVYIAVRRMLELNGNSPGSIVAQVGPAICDTCFVVQDDVAVQFQDVFISNTSGKGLTVDLKGAAVSQLRAAGIPERNIAVSDLCTKCRGDLLYSYRGGCGRGRQLAMIGLV